MRLAKNSIIMIRSCLLTTALVFLISACSSEDASEEGQSNGKQNKAIEIDKREAHEKNLPETTGQTSNSTLKSYGVTFKKFACPNIHCLPLIANIVDNKMLLKSGREPDTLSKTIYLNESQVQVLQKKIKALKLTAMKTVIKPGTNACPSYSTDAPSYQLSLKKGQFSQVLEVYAGCQLGKEQLSLIEWFLNFDQKARKTSDF